MLECAICGWDEDNVRWLIELGTQPKVTICDGCVSELNARVAKHVATLSPEQLRRANRKVGRDDGYPGQ